jgi:ligand-binding sensor domain-containing protein/serine phosphatase RsbU (regulator of sigma subunit)
MIPGTNYNCMMRKSFKVSFLSITFLILVFTGSVMAQKARFQNINVTEGLCHPFIYNIIQDKNGFIWIGTGEGLCRFDGIDFTSSAAFDSLPVDVVNVSFSDNLGKLWFGFNNGELWSYDGNYFVPFHLSDNITTSITGIAQSTEEGILVATQNHGLYYFDSKKELVPFTPSFSDKLISTLHLDARKLFIGTQEGLFIYDLNAGKEGELKEVPALNYVKIQSVINAKEKNAYWIGTEDAGIFFLRMKQDSLQLTAITSNQYKLNYENVQDLTLDKDSNLLVSSYTSGLLKLVLDPENESLVKAIQQYNANNGLPTNFIKCAFVDRERNTWLGTYGSGIALQTNQSFAFYNYEGTGIDNSILSLALNIDLIWLGSDNGILQINKNSAETKMFSSANGLPKDKITSLFYREGILWAGTATSGIFMLTAGANRFSPFFVSDNTISNSINYITGDNDNLYAATKNGIYSVNYKSKQFYNYNTINGLPHNDIQHLFLDNENRLLFATRTNGIYEVNEKGEVENYFTLGKYAIDFNSIAQDHNGNIWATTYGQGVFLLMPDSVINITVKDGLKSNYCYSITSDDSLYVWVGHRLGLSRIEINKLSVSTFGSENGITGDFNHNASAISPDQMLYFGTTEGLLTYDAKSGYKQVSTPKTNILHVFISDKEYDFRKPIVLPYAAYKLRIEYVGLNYADPQAVTYQYKLDGYDLDWSEITSSRTASYPRVEDGEYTFVLKSIGSDGATSELPISVIIKVKLPVWKTWWFISLMAIVLILGLIVIIKYRERKQRQIQEYLELRLDERTREVVEQKEEIEIKNRDITDSINYAQRIQASILPPLKRLQQHFSGSFIFYQPRDIVSGDFYWFDKLKENKFIIVCADSTGHGVPGAFMSMIGTTLIKDVCMRPEVNAPSEILRELDQELRNTLNQNVDAEQSNDGMDTIVCEIDVRSNYLRYASAMRPMIVYKNGEQIYVKGSRSSVGGQYDKDEKDFRDEGIQLDKGDLIYMFSDGYPDQFGGSVGKKFKMVRLKNLLRDIHQKPMEEQYEYVKSTFNLWKEDFEQVDDVLFMGIKI